MASPTFAKSSQHICGNVHIQSSKNFDFSRNDKVFICGDDASSVWGNIPLNQKKYHVSAVLEKSGYYNPVFTESDGKLLVEPGPLSPIREVQFLNAPPSFQSEVRRKEDEGPLTASKLSEIQSWTSSHLRTMGYPCPEVKTQASSTTGVIYVELKPGPLLNIKDVKRPENSYSHIYKRYDAFNVGKLYNHDKLTLTSERIMLDDKAQYAHFQVACEPDGASLTQNVALGKPRILTFSIGSSTEEAVITKVQWKHTRLGDEASTLKAEASYSPRKQQLLVSSQLYFSPDWVYTFFLPEVSVTRESEPSYETVTRRFGTLLGHIEDSEHFRYYLKAGPYYNHLSTLKGEGPRRSTYISWEANAKIVSHYYEYYRANPRKGYYLDLSYKSQRKGVASELNADQFILSGTYLKNYKQYDPPLHVFGLRFSLKTTIVENSQIPLLPQDYRLTLGGDDNIRGFSRKSINNANRGYISTAYAGLEWRLNQVLPFKLQPFLFVDAAKVGEESLELNESFLWAPGLGMRWPSPIGSFRVTASKGQISQPEGEVANLPRGWVYFLSYGTEF